jgi:hypothetical protein
MNFIYTILFFIAIGLSALGISMIVHDHDWHTFYISTAVIAFVAASIDLIIMFFYQLSGNNSQLELFNQMRKQKRKIEIEKTYLTTYKQQLEEVMTKTYPNYEEKIFKDMAPGDSEQLSAILIKYPELKFDGVLKSYVKDIKNSMDNILDRDYRLEDLYSQYEDYQVNGWLLKIYNLPQDLNR